MSAILEMLSNQIGADGVRKIGQSIGADEASTGKAVGAALPLLLGALARNSQSPEGAQALHGAVSRDHDGGILDNVTQFLGSGDGGAGNGILGHVLGNRRQAVEQGVGKASGLDASAVSRLLPMLAPLVMGAVGRSQRQANADPGALAGLLDTERSQVESQMPALGGLARLLDSDGDGQVGDDLANLGKRILGGFLRR